MTDFINGRIYKLVDYNDVNTFYVGSTTQTLSKRLVNHRSDMKRFPDRPKSLWMLENPDIKIILIEEVKVKNRRELEQKEDYYIMKFKN